MALVARLLARRVFRHSSVEADTLKQLMPFCAAAPGFAAYDDLRLGYEPRFSLMTSQRTTPPSVIARHGAVGMNPDSAILRRESTRVRRKGSTGRELFSIWIINELCRYPFGTVPNPKTASARPRAGVVLFIEYLWTDWRAGAP